MIFPKEFPYENGKESERKVFEILKTVSNKYDIFYSRRFVGRSKNEKSEYEIDFIITIPNKVILCLEVKGGILSYNGEEDTWLQSGKRLQPHPDVQASASTHSLISRYYHLSKDIPFDWALCFPNCEVDDKTNLPNSINGQKLIDSNTLKYIDHSLKNIFDDIIERYPQKIGCSDNKYDSFRKELTKSIGFKQLLKTRILADNEKFIELTERQSEVIKSFIDNQHILVSGPAGSGKTIIAQLIAQTFGNDQKKVLLLCFNRTLSNKMRHESGLHKHTNVQVTTFHSFAKRIIDDSLWWEENKLKEDFWDLEVPSKLDSMFQEIQLEFDVLIIDEGQDFKNYWFEILFNYVKPTGKILIFVDKLQDIFNRDVTLPPVHPFFSTVKLEYNCRNTTKIIEYLKLITNQDIKNFPRNPIGEEVVIRNCKNTTEEQTFLNQDIHNLISLNGIKAEQILILINSEKKESCLSETKKLNDIELLSLNPSGRFKSNKLHYSTINTFKGLESDVVMIVDIQKIPKNDLLKKLYTEASRAKHKLFLYQIN